MTNAHQPIGIFDSGVGGLTVVRAIRAALPAEDIIYLGDTARVPYGTKSAATVTRYARACADFLLERDVKLVVCACNTATAHALPALEARVGRPVIGAVEPGARAAHSLSRNGHIGVIGTLGTIRSGAYGAALRALSPDVSVSGQACGLLVPLAEEGWTEGPIASEVAVRYLSELAEKDPFIDTLVLGCTHYPLLVAAIAHAAAAAFAQNVTLVDSAGAMARVAQDTLRAHDLRNPRPGSGTLRCFVTDASRLPELGARFLGEPLPDVEVVDLVGGG
jgi:glutamate racemase